jgi:hypothetical protein
VDLDPRLHKWPSKEYKKISCFEEPDIFSGGLEASRGAWMYVTVNVFQFLKFMNKKKKINIKTLAFLYPTFTL